MRRSNLIVGFIAWAIVVGGGVFLLARHHATPGAAAPALAAAEVVITDNAAPDKMTLVMFLHPQCPCSLASLEELSQLMSRYGSRVSASVVIFQAGNELDEWQKSPAYRSAIAIPNVVVRPDRDAVLARKCHAQTSGQVFLYGKDGHLLFEGGITGSRGHVGDNDGLDALTDLILEKTTGNSPTRMPVFGCAIYATGAGIDPFSNKVRP